jgi:excisionase family DNA binding protein
MEAAPQFMTVAEVADLLRVSRAALDRWVKSGKFPAPSKFGGAIKRFNRTAVLAFVASHETREPIEVRQRKADRRTARGRRKS